MKKLVKRSIVTPLQQTLRQGLTLHELAVTLIIGVIIATFPMFGVTTVLCALVASALNLNQVVIQIANYVGYPLQFALFIPLIRLGEMMFGLAPVTIDLSEAGLMLWDQPLHFVRIYGMAIGSACLIWTLIVLPFIVVLNKLMQLWLKVRKSFGDAL